MPKPPGAAWRVQPATRRGSWTAQLDRCSIKQKRQNDQTVVPPGGGTVEDNGHPDQSIWGESSLHQTRGAPHGEFHGAPQGGLADEQAGERGVGIEVVVGEHPYRLELLIPQQMGLVDDQDGGLAALVAFGGEHGGGLGGEPGVAAVGLAAEGRGDHLVQAPYADHRVRQVDDGVPGGIEAGQDGADRDGLAGPDFAGYHPDGPFGDAPGDPGAGLVVGGVAVQNGGGQGPAAGASGEPVAGPEPGAPESSFRRRGGPAAGASC